MEHTVPGHLTILAPEVRPRTIRRSLTIVAGNLSYNVDVVFRNWRADDSQFDRALTDWYDGQDWIDDWWFRAPRNDSLIVLALVILLVQLWLLTQWS